MIYCSDPKDTGFNDPSNAHTGPEKLTNLQNNKNEQQKGGLNENDQINYNRQLPKDYVNARNPNASFNKQQNVNFQIYNR